MLHVAFVGTGTFPASLEQPVRRHLTVPCEIVVASEADILPRLPEDGRAGDDGADSRDGTGGDAPQTGSGSWRRG